MSCHTHCGGDCMVVQDGTADHLGHSVGLTMNFFGLFRRFNKVLNLLPAPDTLRHLRGGTSEGLGGVQLNCTCTSMYLWSPVTNIGGVWRCEGVSDFAISCVSQLLSWLAVTLSGVLGQFVPTTEVDPDHGMNFPDPSVSFPLFPADDRGGWEKDAVLMPLCWVLDLLVTICSILWRGGCGYPVPPRLLFVCFSVAHVPQSVSPVMVCLAVCRLSWAWNQVRVESFHQRCWALLIWNQCWSMWMCLWKETWTLWVQHRMSECLRFVGATHHALG